MALLVQLRAHPLLDGGCRGLHCLAPVAIGPQASRRVGDPRMKSARVGGRDLGFGEVLLDVLDEGAHDIDCLSQAVHLHLCEEVGR